ncbi:Ras-related protein Rab-13 [Tritrichomonas foetus]|uniref:Ras-related protein Rab-13 n=1 Tax=Tritrichomonas foetus TaxID=1144522 RepID=A0A1J4L1A8_9EUKA|nr:Ras-related protein Rab-13 [Tritrichomonas foetus]|eukprot:OHT15669.1 Ras-related protein Rab-13 [Tritrichomonas foetus]
MTVLYSIQNYPKQGDYYVNHPELDQSRMNDFCINDGNLKFVILGEPSVGKTCLTTRACYDKFSNTYEATIGVQFSQTTCEINSHQTKLCFWDTSGQQRYTEITSHYFRGADVAFFCFSLNDQISLQSLENWIISLNEHTQPVSAAFLVGCKSDIPQTIRDVEIEKFAKSNNLEYFKTSSKNSTNITDLIQRAAFVGSLVKQIRTKQNKEKFVQHKKITEAKQVDISNQEKKEGGKCCA